MPTAVHFVSIPDIDTYKMKFTGDFFLGLNWHDYRIQYLDLNQDHIINPVSWEDKKALWIPRVMFENALDNFVTENEEKSSAYIERGKTYNQSDYTEAQEGIPGGPE